MTVPAASHLHKRSVRVNAGAQQWRWGPQGTVPEWPHGKESSQASQAVEHWAGLGSPSAQQDLGQVGAVRQRQRRARTPCPR